MVKPTNQHHEEPKINAIGDSALLLQLSDEISLVVNDRIRALNRRLENQPKEGILEWVPGYTSLMVFYDPTRLDLSAVKSHLLACLGEAKGENELQQQQITIPVCYGGADGPDLAFIADYHNLSSSEVVRRHAAPTYRVGMMGFTPGFAYLMGLDPTLATSRRDTPRTRVPAGSVGIAGTQTGIYSLASPGGWQLIGRTEWALYRPESDCPFLLSPGDEVRFLPLAEGVIP